MAHADVSATYEQIRIGLSPRRRVIDPVAVDPLRLPAPPARWDVPLVGSRPARWKNDLRAFLTHFAARQQVVLAATAVGLVVPLVVDDVLAASLQRASALLDSSATVGDREHAAEAVKQATAIRVEASSRTGATGAVVLALVTAASAAGELHELPRFAGQYAGIAISQAARASALFDTGALSPGHGAGYTLALNRFLRGWWARCRCRLAFADAPSAALQ